MLSSLYTNRNTKGGSEIGLSTTFLRKSLIFRVAAKVYPNIKVFSAPRQGPSMFGAAEPDDHRACSSRGGGQLVDVEAAECTNNDESGGHSAQPGRTRLASRSVSRRFRTVSMRVVAGLRLRRPFPKHLTRVVSNAADPMKHQEALGGQAGAGEPEVEFRRDLRGAHAPMHPPCTCKRTGCTPKHEARAVAPKMPWHDVVQSDIAGVIVPEGKSYRAARKHTT